MGYITTASLSNALELQKKDASIGVIKPIGFYFLATKLLNNLQISQILNLQAKYEMKSTNHSIAQSQNPFVIASSKSLFVKPSWFRSPWVLFVFLLTIFFLTQNESTVKKKGRGRVQELDVEEETSIPQAPQVKIGRSITNEVDHSDQFIFEGSVSVAHPAGFLEFSDDCSGLQKFFVASKATWENVGNNQWVATIANSDPLTGKQATMKFLLEKAVIDGAKHNFLRRIIVNNVELSAVEVTAFAYAYLQ